METIRLKEFVSQTLTEIVEGVLDAQGKVIALAEKGTSLEVVAQVSPTIDNLHARQNTWRSSWGSVVQNVEFDVAVTISKEKGGKGGISVWGAGLEGGATASNSSVSRIRFYVPITLPQEDGSKRV